MRFERRTARPLGVAFVSTALAVVSLSCASQENSPFDSSPFVEMTVVNRAENTLTVFAWWRAGARVRLGEIRGGATRTFNTPLRSDEVWLSFDVLAGRRVGRPNPPEFFVPVQAGDGIEWEIRPTYAVFYRRLARN